ncbi:MAG: DUF2194 domain-containing protein [Anaerolineae bacterium]|nr:DUF2194 domain-containing protein [Anaerolineae bacterium]
MNRKVVQRSNHIQQNRPWLRRRWLFVVLLLLLFLAVYHVIPSSTGPQPVARANTLQQFILVVHDSSDNFDPELLNNTQWALNYARLNYDTLDINQGSIWPNLDQYSVLLFVAEDLNKIDPAQARRIIDYVTNGGGLAVAYRGWHPQLAPLFAVLPETQPKFSEYNAETGLYFPVDFLPALKGLVLGKAAIPGHSKYDLQLMSDAHVQIIATTKSGLPLAWLNQYGRGRTLFWNTDILSAKDARGFIVQSVLAVQSVGVLPMANFATLQIDDFPLPVSTQKLEPIKSEYDLSMVDFFNQVWFPDMMELAQRYNLIYTCLIPFNYNSLLEPPFDFREWDNAKVEVDAQRIPWSIYTSHLLAQGHELGMHGYNHVSLLLAFWVVEKEEWQAAKKLLAAHELLAAWEQSAGLFDREKIAALSPAEIAQKSDAQTIVARAVAKKRAEAEVLVNAKTDLAVLAAGEETETLSTEQKDQQAEAAAIVAQAGEQKIAEAQALLTLPDAEIARLVIEEARAEVIAAGGEAKIAEAAAFVAEAEQKAEENMVAGLIEARKRWEADNLGLQPVSYVAPNNLYDEAGARALSRAFPTIKVLAGSYVGPFDTGADREFSPEPWNPQLFNMPRMTYSYDLNPSSRFAWISGLNMMGVWTYFNHPDDVYHVPQNYPGAGFYRNPTSLPWRGDHTGKKDGFYYQFVEWLELAAQEYPWVRYVRTDESLDFMQTHLANQVTVDLSPTEIRFTATTPTYFQVRVNDGRRIDLNTLQGAQFVDYHRGDGYRLYILNGISPQVQFTLLPADDPSFVPFGPAAEATPLLPQEEENDVLPTEYRDSPSLVPVRTVAPTPTRVPTATPAYHILPIPTPTVRLRP